MDKVAVGESPSVAMHVPVPLLRARPSGEPRSVAELGQASVALGDGGGGGGGGGGGVGSGAGGGAGSESGYEEFGNESMLTMFPEWHGWTQPSVALTLRAVLMTASALSAAAGMQQPMIGIEKGGGKGGGGGGGEGKGKGKDPSGSSGQPTQEELARRRRGVQILFPEGVVPNGDLSDLRAFFEALWPNSPYSFGTYSRDSVSSDMSYLSGGDGADGGGGSGGNNKKQSRKKGEKRLVLVVNVSSPGNEDAAESDGEARGLSTHTPLVHWSIRPLVIWSIGPFIDSFIDPFIGPFIHSLVHSLVHRSIHCSTHLTRLHALE